MTLSDTNDPPLFSGATPGLVDPSQRTRLLRSPSCRLFFAAFDPLTAHASGFPNLSSLHIDSDKASKHVNSEASTNSNGKRIVVETDLETGTSSWRFVPRARVEGGVSGEEGPWPRQVELCGRLVLMTQDQWDIHKLDPEYDCVVRVPPSLTIIARKSSKTNTLESNTPVTSDSPTVPNTASVSMDVNTPNPTVKKGSSSASLDSDNPRKERRYKRLRVRPALSSDTDKMAVDDDIFFTPHTSTSAINDRHGTNKKKRTRLSTRSDDLGCTEAGSSNGKMSRSRESSIFSDLSSNPFSGNGQNDTDASPTHVKKVRTCSPGSTRRKMMQKRMNRENRRKADMDARFKWRREFLNRAFWADLGVPSDPPGLGMDLNDVDDPGVSEDESDGGRTESSDTETEIEDEAGRRAKIEESRRKLAELEKDKPLWEESARRREAKEKEDEQMRQRAKQMKEEEERQRQHAQAARRQWEQERKELQREAQMRQQSSRMFLLAPRGIRWSIGLALERYLETATNFDAAKFAPSNRPLTFTSIPWPMLNASFSIQDIEWDAVETFFDRVKGLLTAADFKTLVEKSHRRFHPDRWRSRGLLVTVKDETERDLLEVAGSTVAQSLTPLWKQVTGR